MGESGRGKPVIDVYARLSHAVNGETIKVDDQVEMCEETLARRGARRGELFKDNSLSAWRPKVVRPQWEALMARLEAGASDGVIVYDLTRFSRKPREGERLVDLADRGLRVWALSGEYDLGTADGRKHFRDAMNAAAYESDKISERVKRGKLRRARKGRVHGGGRTFGLPGNAARPKGWEPGDPREAVGAEQVEAERAVVRECYARLLAGEPLSGLVDDLNARGVRTATGRRWRRNSLRGMLARAALAGLVVHRGQVIGALAGVEPVVAREEWERVCALFDARRRGRPPGRVHWLSGLMRCGQCGGTVGGAPRYHLPPYPDGSPKREYRCRRTADKPGCGLVHIDALAAETAVAEAVKTRLGDPRSAARIAKRLAGAREQRGKIEAEMRMLNESADELAGKTAQWGVERVDKAMAPILRRLDKLHGALAALEEPEDARAATADAAAAWDEAAARGDLDTLRAMTRRAFPRLTLRAGARWGDHSAARFDWDGAGGAPPLPPDPREVLWDALRAAWKDGATGKELIEATGMSTTWVYKRLQEHVRAGRITKTSPAGAWRITNPGEQAPPSSPREVREVLWEALRAAGPDGLACQELAEATGRSTSWVYRRLQEQVRAGRVAPTSPPGRWRATGPAG
jgi:DNA invertase Pin-like site-specific DNA recombinase